MSTPHFSLARRGLIAAALGVGAGLFSRRAVAQGADSSGNAAPAAASGPLWTSEYWAKKGEVSLYLYRKRTGLRSPASERCLSCSWCTGPRTPRAPASTSPCRAAANIR